LQRRAGISCERRHAGVRRVDRAYGQGWKGPSRRSARRSDGTRAAASTSDRLLLIEWVEQLADCRVQLGEAAEPAIALASDTVPVIVDRLTGDVRQAQIFAAVMGARS
jgi:hypothetical protein